MTEINKDILENDIRKEIEKVGGIPHTQEIKKIIDKCIDKQSKRRSKMGIGFDTEAQKRKAIECAKNTALESLKRDDSANKAIRAKSFEKEYSVKTDSKSLYSNSIIDMLNSCDNVTITIKKGLQNATKCSIIIE